MKKKVIINLICDADKELPESRDNELIRDDIIRELSCCWHLFEVQNIEIKDNASFGKENDLYLRFPKKLRRRKRR